MIKKFLKSILVFITVFCLVFSNLPYNFLVDSISLYQKTNNIIDKFWRLEQNKNIVDNFQEREIFPGLKINYASAAVGDARIQYGFRNNSTPKTRFYNNITNAFGAESNTVAGTATIGWVVSKESPTEDLTVMVTQSTTGRMDVFCRNNMGVWTKDISGIVVSANSLTRRFDVEFEKTSGIPMVLYSRNVATTNELAYYRKTGAGCGAGAWTVSTNLDPTRVTAAVLWVELEARQTSGSNVLAAAFSDATATQGGKLQAMIWTGSAWGNESPAGAANGWSDLSIELMRTAGANSAKVFDLAFETNSGDLLIAWGTSLGSNGTNGWRYATCAAALPCTWSAVQTPAGPTDDATNVACAADPDSDAIACAAQGNAGNDLTAWRWTGTAVGAAAANADVTLLTAAASDMHVDIDWVVNGSQRMAVAVYANSTTGYRYIYYDTVGNSWRTNSNNGFVVTGAPSTAGQSIQVVRNPSNKTQLMLSFTDAAQDLWAKKLTYNGAAGGATTALSAWSNSDGGVTLQGTVSSINSGQSFWLDWAQVYTPPQDLTIGATAGSQVTTLNSGATSQYAPSVSCNSAGTCAAFTLSLNNGSDTLTSIKITETGTVDATNNLANFALFYDTDGNFANGVTGQFGSTVGSFTSEAVTVSGSLALTSGVTYYFYPRFDLVKTATYPKGGQTIDFQITANTDVVSGASVTKIGAPATLAGTTTVLPDVVSTTYGSGLADGGRSSESITLSGYGFGVAPVGSRGNCAGAVDTGCVRFTVGGNATVATGDVSAWSNTSITYNINSALASYGGVSAVELVSGSQADASKLNFYIYPNITATTNPVSPYTNAAREYDAGDTDGVVTLSGDHFGSSQGGGSVTVLGQTATINSWNDASIQIRIPVSIPDNSYTGNIIVFQGTGGNSATSDSFGGGTYRILPRITSLNPSSALVGDSITVNGNHFCQNSAVCPSVFDSNNKVVFYNNINAVIFTSWSDTVMSTRVSSGAATGNVLLMSNNYNSNQKNLTVLSSIPDNPILTEPPSRQYKSNNATVINLGDATTENTAILKADISAQVPINMLLQVEVQNTGASFTCAGTNAIGVGGCTAYTAGSGVLEGTVVGGGGCTNCSTLSQAKINFTSLSDGTKHWQARVRNSTTNEYSAWVSYGGNLETEIDFKVDATAPVITNISHGTPGGNSATITWDTSGEQSTSQLQYNKTGTFVDNCATNNDCTTLNSNLVYNHSISISNLDSGATYYYRVRSKDALNNEAISASNSFNTSAITQPGKTTLFYITSAANQISSLSTSSFSVIVPEDAPSVKSAFLEISGLVSGGSNPIDIQVNNVNTRSYSVNATNPTPFKFLYQIPLPNDEASLNLNDAAPCTNGESGVAPCNLLTINPGSGMSVNVYSAKIIITYGYAQ